jgi:hypothetical protein
MPDAFFAEVAKQLGNIELVINNPAALSAAEKQQLLARCLELAIEGETYEYATMYPEFTAQARADRDAAAGFEEQIAESKEHAAIFRRAASNFGFLEALQGKGRAGEAPTPVAGQCIWGGMDGGRPVPTEDGSAGLRSFKRERSRWIPGAYRC